MKFVNEFFESLKNDNIAAQFAQMLNALILFIFSLFCFNNLITFTEKCGLVDHKDLLLYWTTVLLIISSFGFAGYLLKIKITSYLKSASPSFSIELVFIVSIILIYTLERYLVLPFGGIWLDEFLQYQGAVPTCSFIAGSIADIQPPLGSLNTLGTIVLMGKSLFSMKSSSLFSGLLAVLAFYAFCRINKVSKVLAFIFTCILSAFGPFLIQSLEARNLSQMALCFFLLLNSIFIFSNEAKFHNFLCVFFTTAFFLFSAGFQTYIFAGPLLIFSFCLFSSRAHFRAWFLFLLAAGSLCYLLLAPVLSLHFKYATMIGTLHTDVIPSLMLVLNSFKLGSLNYFFSDLIERPEIWGLLITSFILAVLSSQRSRKLLICLSAMTFFCLLSFHFVYFTFITSPLSNRHYFLVSLLLLSTLPLFFGEFIANLKSYSNALQRTILGLCFVLPLVTLQLVFRDGVDSYLNHCNWTSTWAKMYKTLTNSTSFSKRQFYILPVSEKGSYINQEFIAAAFLNPVETAEHFRSTLDSSRINIFCDAIQIPCSAARDLEHFSKAETSVFIYPKPLSEKDTLGAFLLELNPKEFLVTEFPEFYWIALSPQSEVYNGKASSAAYSEKVTRLNEMLLKKLSPNFDAGLLQLELAGIYWQKNELARAKTLINDALARFSGNRKSIDLMKEQLLKNFVNSQK